MTSKIISFVVTCYNHARFIGGCLESILNQKCRFSYEVIVIDDASSDGSQTVIAPIAEANGMNFIRHNRNIGASQSITEGLSKASGEFVCRLDGDDRLLPNFMATQLPPLLADPKIGFTYALVDDIDAYGDVLSSPSQICRPDDKHGLDEFVGDEFDFLVQHFHCPAPSIIFRREALISCLPFPADLAAIDWYLALWVAQTHKSHYNPVSVAEYRQHSSNYSNGIHQRHRYAKGVLAALERLERRANSESIEGRPQVNFAAHRRTFHMKIAQMQMRARRMASAAWHLSQAIGAR